MCCFAIGLPISSPVPARDVSPPEAARLLGVSRAAMDQLVATGQVPVVRLGPPLADQASSQELRQVVRFDGC